MPTTVTLNIQRINNMVGLQATNETGCTLTMDGIAEVGGENLGMRPTQALLASLGGCSSIDVLEILRKQRENVVDYHVEVKGERRDQDPKIFTHIHIHYVFVQDPAQPIDPEHVRRAIDLSMNKYCSVAAMLGAVAKLSSDFEIRNR